jgi:hypothetical protein
MTASLVDRFVGQLTPAAVQVLVVLGVCVDCGQPDTACARPASVAGPLR